MSDERLAQELQSALRASEQKAVFLNEPIKFIKNQSHAAEQLREIAERHKRERDIALARAEKAEQAARAAERRAQDAQRDVLSPAASWSANTRSRTHCAIRQDSSPL